MKNIWQLAFKGSLRNKLLFFMWIALTSSQLGIYFGMGESDKNYPFIVSISPLVGLFICGYGWRSWYVYAKKEREWLDEKSNWNAELNRYITDKTHSEKSSSDKT